ncbi:hypothetical protein C7974DRAFT_317913 [Boeremia exigua]|uniref:uncharacterized protein n=1 Tax=Boeremia exigua TaxID=749465 RepID=UPI001E8EC409|nr:uncharacterized protein C7974DRAFT_317913 [Boeremia exigua]KAH6618732.1 hypothetical protein C7974DRAFT_317913 [Boeremia exigua]
MFGHPGISALEYAGTLAESKEQNRRASVTLPSLKRKSTAETHNDNTTTATAAASETHETRLSLAPVHYIDEFGAQRKRKDMFVNHTPRNFDMRAPQNIEVYRPSTSSSNENYSRPRINSQISYSSSAGPALEQKRLTVNPGSPFELDSREVGVASSPTMFASSPPMSPEVYRPMAAPPQRRSMSGPMTKIITYQPRQARAIISNSHQKRDVRVRSTSTPDHDSKEKKQSRRQTPYKVVGSMANTSLPYASLEPWVAKHERDASRSDTNSDKPTQEDLEKLEEVAPLGVIQKYFDSQADSRESSLRRVRHRHTPSPPKMPLPHSPDPTLRSTEPVTMFPIDDLELITDLPPAVPERSPKRRTNPRFPLRKESITSVDSDFARAAEGQFTEYDHRASEIRISKQRSQHGMVGQAARAGSSCLGRMAPPILGHDALTASSDLGLNDLSFYLRNTGPKTDIQAVSRQHAKGGPKIFKVKRKSLAARVGSVEGSPQRARQKPKVPTCAREMITTSGAKHLRIIIPRLSSTDNPTFPVAVHGSQDPKHRPRRMSLSFTEDLLVPALASPAVERAIQGFSSYDRVSRSFSAPNIMAVAANALRKEKSPPISPIPVPVDEHPLDERPLSREEQTKARKLRDLKRIRRREVPSTISGSASTLQDNSETGAGALPTPRHTPEPGSGEMIGDSAVEIEVLEESSADKMFRLQERVMLLQRQNSALTAALAKVVGLELENGDLEPEHVLQTFRRCRYSRTPSGW